MKAKLFILFVMALFLASSALAIDVCCEKLSGSDEYCVYADEENCDPEFKDASVDCDKTSFCKAGCCYSSGEGKCYKNVPSAKCSSVQGGIWTDSGTCDIPQCRKGCCLLGSQGFFVTEVRCKLETSSYGNVNMQWQPGITSEPECQAQARSQDMGCCVSGEGCIYTTRGNCPATSTTPVSGEETGEGFYEDLLCSNDLLSCGCAKQTNTGCYGDKVYWFDSCGNRENVYSSDKEKSYNNGYSLNPGSICDSPASLNPSCGNCDYSGGSICRSSTTSQVKPDHGEFICSTTECESTKNGESWCVYDSAVGKAQDPVGARHYRHMCINGEKMPEPCMDYREEICIQGVLGEEPTTTYQAFQATGDYIEATCRDNRWEDCSDCNEAQESCGTACSDAPVSVSCNKCSKKDKENVERQAKALAVKLCCAKKCCENEMQRDCYFLQGGGQEEMLPLVVEAKKGGAITAIRNIGYCVPQVPPGLQFWSSDTGELPGSTTRSSAATTAAVTTGKQEGAHGGSGPDSNADGVCSFANQECTVKWKIGGTGKLGIGGITTKKDYECIENCHCTEPEWVIGGNTLCKALGDCGAYFNILGKITMDGYANTASEETKGRKGLYFNGYKLQEKDVGDWKILSTKGDPLIAGGGGKKGFFSSIGGYLKDFGVPLAVFAASGLYSYAMGGKFMQGATGGLSVLGQLPKLLTKGGSKELGAKAHEIYGSQSIKEGKQLIIKDVNYKFENGKWAELKDLGDTSDWVEVKDKDTLKELNKKAMKKKGANIMGTVNSIMWLYTIYKLIDVIFADTKEQTYTMACSSWVAPEGGSDCTKCNDDPDRPCSIYRCKSLGQSCYLVNMGSSEEKCINMNPNDVSSPIIEPWEEVIPEGYTITPASIEGNKGYKVNGKIGPYDSITLGIKTNEPSQCKFTDNVGTDFDEMTTFFGDSQYLYEHETTFVIPAEFTTEEALRETGNNYNLYIRCKDTAGNKNERDYFIRFTLESEPDMTAPRIERTSIEDGAHISYDVTQARFSVYTNEMASCKYDTVDKEYDLMENEFECSTSAFTANSAFHGSYECETMLQLENLIDYEWYIRCKDTAGNKNRQSYRFSLTPSEPLEIISIGPSGTFYESDVTLKAVTHEGAENGKATCAYSLGDEPFSNMVMFLNTDSTLHEQLLIQEAGEFTYYVKCIDAAGSMASGSMTFTIDVDSIGPKLLYIYVTPSNYLHIEMDESSTCEYSNGTFTYGTGNTMTGSWTVIHELSITESMYHIICQDEYYNEASFVVYP